VIYDRFGVPAVCRGCGATTYWYVNRDYPLCPECALKLAEDIRRTLKDVDVKKIVEEENKVIVIKERDGRG